MIEFREVSKTYADGSTAVANFSYVVPSNKISVMLGSSGSGKTTLMRMVNRMIDPTMGRVLIDGIDVSEADAVELRRSIGYVLQQGGLLPHRTVLDNISTVPVLNGMNRKKARARSYELLETVGLDASMALRYPAQLSGGQQQRVGVARALAADPSLLLMDEPFGAVDPISRRELQSELLRIQSDLGKTILLVTHDVDEAFLLGDEVVVLKTGGVIAQTGTPSQIVATPADDFVRKFIGQSTDKELSVTNVSGKKIVVDSSGRPLGVLAT